MTIPTDAELLPCPFCGKAHTLIVGAASEMWDEDDHGPFPHTETYAVFCDASSEGGKGGCGGSGGYFVTKEDAIAAWNSRAPQAVREPTIQWPKARDVGRIGDMSPGDFMRVGLDSDNDAYVSVCGGDGMGSVEFCQPGAGGGKSSRTREALIALMVAMEQDNAEDPGRDWWARRMGGITKGGQHGAP